MAEWIGRMQNQAVIVSVFLVVGVILSGGCGQNGSAEAGEQTGQEIEDVPGRDGNELNVPESVAAAGQQEENSLEEWQASLQEGSPEELTAQALRGVSVVRDGAPYFAVSYEPRAYKNSFDCWAISEPYQSMATVDTEAMYEYFRILADMEMTPVDGITREQAGTDKDADTVFAAYYSGQTEAGGQAEPDRGITYYFGKQDAEGNYYVEAGGAIWLVDGNVAARLFAVEPYDCILKVVSVVNVETVSKVTVEFADNRYEMRLGDGMFLWDGKNVDSAKFYELYTELMSIFIEKEMPREEQGNTDAAGRALLMRVIYERNMEDAPTIIQNYYAYDDEYASVQVNGMEFFLVSREGLGRLQRRIEETF